MHAFTHASIAVSLTRDKARVTAALAFWTRNRTALAEQISTVHARRVAAHSADPSLREMLVCLESDLSCRYRSSVQSIANARDELSGINDEITRLVFPEVYFETQAYRMLRSGSIWRCQRVEA